MGRHGENIRKRSDGRWEARYMVYDEKREKKISRSVYGHTYEEVKTKRAAVSGRTAAAHEARIDQGTKITTVLEISFGTAAEEWLAALRLEQKLSTCEKYSFIYHRYLEKALANVKIHQITEKLITDRLASCETVSDSILKSIYSVLNGILWYVSEQYQMPFLKVKRPMPTACRRETKVFTTTEQARLLSALYMEMDRFKMGMLLCLFTGLRLGELCALKWSDIDFMNRTLTVKRTVQRLYVESGKNKTALVEVSPKSDYSKREVPLPDAALKLLLNYKNVKEYIFGGDKPLDPRTMQNHYKTVLKETDLPYKNFHSLRHTYATNSIEGGADIKSLSEMLDHSNVKTTLNYYVHPSMDTKRMYADSLCAFYGRLWSGSG